MSEETKRLIPYVMHGSGAIPGVPNPDHQGGLWPGGITVYVDPETSEVDHISLIGGSGDEAGQAPVAVPEAKAEQTPMQAGVESGSSQQRMGG